MKGRPPRLMQHIVFLTISGVVIALGSPLVSWQPAVHAVPPQEDPLPDIPGRYMGVQSCATASCHGQEKARKDDPACQEYATWRRKDSHAKAYRTLTQDERSAKWLAKLEDLDGGGGKWEPNPGKNPRCLTCHGVSLFKEGSLSPTLAVDAHPQYQMTEDDGKNAKPFDAKDGISCDGCHGPGEKWLYPHDQKKPDWVIKQWKKLGDDPDTRSRELFRRIGVYYSKDLVYWANQCTRCHLSIDTNMLDAGHPDLVPFELYRKSRDMPRHWRDYSKSDPDDETLPAPGPFHGFRVWLTGQAVALEYAAGQVQQRAGRLGYNKPATKEGQEAHLKVAFDRAWAHYLLLTNTLATIDADAKATLDTSMADLKKAMADGSDPSAAVMTLIDTAHALARKLSLTKIDAGLAKDVLLGVCSDERLRSDDTPLFVKTQAGLAVWTLYYSFAITVRRIAKLSKADKKLTGKVLKIAGRMLVRDNEDGHEKYETAKPSDEGFEEGFDAVASCVKKIAKALK